MIRAILFDFGGTLAETTTSWEIVAERIAERYKLEDINIDPVELENAFKETIEYRMNQHQHGFEIDSYQFFNHALDQLGYSADMDQTDEFEQIVYDEGYTDFATGLDELLMELSEDYKLALLSNSWLEAPRQALIEHGYGRWFDAMVCSFDIGIPKPDPRIFQFTLELLGVQAGEAVMVGDSLEADVKGALAAGMRAVLVDDGFSDWDGPKVVELSELPDVLRRLDS